MFGELFDEVGQIIHFNTRCEFYINYVKKCAKCNYN